MPRAIRTMSVPVSVAAGAAVDCTSLGVYNSKVVQVTGTFVATVQIQGSIDGSTWVNEGTAFTATGAIEVTKPWPMMRANTTAFTSGVPLAKIAG